MKIAIQGHPTRGKEVIQTLESLGGINKKMFTGIYDESFYFIDYKNEIDDDYKEKFPPTYKLYTLEEFETQFPFKIGDKVIDHEGDVAIITGFAYIEEKLGYSLQYENGRGTATSGILKPYKEMKEERNITLTLDKAQEWYKKDGELKEIALQAFSEEELTKIDLPKTWREFCENYPIQVGEAIVDEQTSQIRIYKGIVARGLTYDKNIYPSEKSAEAHLAMIQLEQLRNYWWNGWKPNWLEGNVQKYVIRKWRDKIVIGTSYVIHSFLSFPTYEMAEEFLECFRDLIEQAGDLI